MDFELSFVHGLSWGSNIILLQVSIQLSKYLYLIYFPFNVYALCDSLYFMLFFYYVICLACATYALRTWKTDISLVSKLLQLGRFLVSTKTSVSVLLKMMASKEFLNNYEVLLIIYIIWCLYQCSPNFCSVSWCLWNIWLSTGIS